MRPVPIGGSAQVVKRLSTPLRPGGSPVSGRSRRVSDASRLLEEASPSHKEHSGSGPTHSPSGEVPSSFEASAGVAPGTRSRMQRTKQRDNQSEMALRSALHSLGLRFRLHRRLLPGSTRTADVVFPSSRVAVFLDGCFWHGCPVHGTWPKRNGDWWRAKIEANQQRDRNTDERLAALGWRVARVWEHEQPAQAAARIAILVREGRLPGVTRT